MSDQPASAKSTVAIRRFDSQPSPTLGFDHNRDVSTIIHSLLMPITMKGPLQCFLIAFTVSIFRKVTLAARTKPTPRVWLLL